MICVAGVLCTNFLTVFFSIFVVVVVVLALLLRLGFGFRAGPGTHFTKLFSPLPDDSYYNYSMCGDIKQFPHEQIYSTIIGIRYIVSINKFSVTRLLGNFSALGHLQQPTFAQQHKKLPNQIQMVAKQTEQTHQNLSKWRNFAKSGHSVNHSGATLSRG